METVKQIKILFDIQHSGLRRRLEVEVSKVEEVCGVRINVEVVEDWEVLRRLRANLDYDFVILHLGGETRRNAYEVADECRNLSNAVLVAESKAHLHGREEVLQHFDEYIYLIDEHNLKHFLRKYHFLP